MVAVQADNGQAANFRALPESGSQINMNTERLALMLSLKNHDIKLRVEDNGVQPLELQYGSMEKLSFWPAISK